MKNVLASFLFALSLIATPLWAQGDKVPAPSAATPAPAATDTAADAAARAKAVQKAYEMEHYKDGVAAKESTGDYVNIAQSMQEHVMGDPAAPLTIIEYASLTCGHCAQFHKEILPQVVKKYISTGKIKMIYRDFPLNGLALQAAQLAQCMPEDRYFPFVKTLHENLESWAEGDALANLTQYAKLAGMPPGRIKACLDNKELQEALIKRRMEAERQFKIAATPSFVINYGQEVLSGLATFEDFEKAIAKYVK